MNNQANQPNQLSQEKDRRVNENKGHGVHVLNEVKENASASNLLRFYQDSKKYFQNNNKC